MVAIFAAAGLSAQTPKEESKELKTVQQSSEKRGSLNSNSKLFQATPGSKTVESKNQLLVPQNQKIMTTDSIGNEYVSTERISVPTAKAEEMQVYEAVEVKASFNGGDAALEKWISKNLQYPQIAKEDGIEGRVIVRFIVGKDGKISNAKVIKGVDPELDREAVRLISNMPDWIPAKNANEAVASYYILKVPFKL